MMDQKPARKMDRRTQYTRMVIKEALIALMREKPFPRITVKELCTNAEINRGTLYLHYLDLPDVLDDIENEIVASVADELRKINLFDDQLRPRMESFLNMLAGQELAELLLVKQAEYSHLLEKMVAIVKENVLPEMQEQLGLTHELADCLFTFLFGGTVAVNRELAKQKRFGWTAPQELLHRFTVGGVKAIVGESK